ncbi:hypothetical protein GAYE_SCF13G3395 [Galdieria yellowstonensis]|uniref:Zinc-finger domain-containing protein n=1 Tax=Galdieria yellowstonensis TaxID=3028027 RepID=A0AAV9IDM7_9RHOD|nr:hypothetical protein GAYE_SCF13G3395 [Galdieria yellowstonensis]
MEWPVSSEANEETFCQNIIFEADSMEEICNNYFFASTSSLGLGCLKHCLRRCAHLDCLSEDQGERLTPEYTSNECTVQNICFPELATEISQDEVLENYLVDDYPNSSNHNFVIESWRSFQKDDFSLSDNFSQEQASLSQDLCKEHSVVESRLAASEVARKPPFFKDSSLKEYNGKKTRGRPSKCCKWIEDLSNSPVVLNSYKRRQPRKYKELKYSKFCHICNRNIRRVPLYHCSNVEKGLRRKAVCLFCIGEYKIALENGKKVSTEFVCPHCTNSCPDTAQCKTYLKTNLRRRAKVLASRS